MKRSMTLVLFTIAISIGNSFGVIVATSNLIAGNPTETPILDINGGGPFPLSSGVIAMGYFEGVSDAALSTTSVGNLISGFVQFGDATTNGFQNAFNAPGFFSHSTSALLPSGSNSFTGRNIYTLIGSGSTIASSHCFGIWKSDVKFGSEDDLNLGIESANVTPGEGVLLRGSSGGPIDISPSPSTFIDSIVITQNLADNCVPEPSSAFLLGLGALGLLIRRKR